MSVRASNRYRAAFHIETRTCPLIASSSWLVAVTDRMCFSVQEQMWLPAHRVVRNWGGAGVRSPLCAVYRFRIKAYGGSLCGLVARVPDYRTEMYCFLWGTNWICICYVEEGRRRLWSSGQSSWLQIQRSGFDSWRYQIFWEVMGLERGPLSLVSTTEELLGRKRSDSGLENREYVLRDPSLWPRGTLYPQKVGTNFADKWRSLGRYSSLAN
jgi:hypothetical protein